MARKLTLPIGDIASGDIEVSLQKGCERLAIELKERFGAESQVLMRNLLLQYEAAGNTSSEAELKNFQEEISVRLSFARGGKLIFAWTRSRPVEVAISLDSSSQFEDWAFLGLFAIPALIDLMVFLSAAAPTAGRGSDVALLLLYLPLFAVFVGPYFVLRAVMRAKNNDVLEAVESAVRAKIDG